jgi:peptidoglycan/LPS O-acetylase OafA/YrhL
MLSAKSNIFLQGFFSSNFLLLFAFGAATAFLCMSRIKLVHPLFVALLGAVTFLIVGLAEITPPYSAPWIINPLIPYGLASSVLIFGLVQFEDRGRQILNQGWIQLLGGASYVLYLIHFPLISVFVKLCRALGLKGITGALLSYVSILVACAVCAVVFHVFIERPLLDFLAKAIRHWSAPRNVPQGASR